MSVAKFVTLAFLLVGAAGLARADSGWTAHSAPVFSGQYGAVGDPSVIRGKHGLLMFHQCLDVQRDPQGSEICLAVSDDGIDWAFAKTKESTFWVKSRLLRARASDWDAAHETPFAQSAGDEIRLYVLGYKGNSVFTDQASARFGMVSSADPLGFTPLGPPIFSGQSPGDKGGLTSPSVVNTPNGAAMFYTGWSCAMNRPECQKGSEPTALSLMAVMLDAKGLPKGAGQVVVGDPQLYWTIGGISEAEVTIGPDGRYYLFFSSLSGKQGTAYATQRIGLAVSDDPLGPYEFSPDPILIPEDFAGSWTNGGILAPTVLIEATRIRLWFHAFEIDGNGAIQNARVGYAEHAWPIK